MANQAREKSDEHALAYWSNALVALVHLTTEGMSDEEETFDSEGGRVKLVFSPSFRSPIHDDLFDEVDQTPAQETMIFTNSGRPRLPRIRSTQLANRPPPANLPAIYRRGE